MAENLTLNADALLVILNALAWAGHDTRLPQGERDMYVRLAEQLAQVPVPKPKLIVPEVSETSQKDD